MSAPCVDLITVEDLEACPCSEAAEADTDMLALQVSRASMLAWALSGRRYGTCDVEAERPGRLRTCGCYRVCTCGCDEPDEVFLGNAPVSDVTEVRIAGEVVDPTTYRLIAPNRLIRLGGALWPTCQLLGADDDADGVLVVDYQWGVPVDALGVAAIAAYACELVKACLGKPCSLPENVTSVARQGIAFQIQTPSTYLDEGRTGVPVLDQWLTAVNPGRLRRPMKVWSPDVVAPVVFPPVGS